MLNEGCSPPIKCSEKAGQISIKLYLFMERVFSCASSHAHRLPPSIGDCDGAGGDAAAKRGPGGAAGTGDKLTAAAKRGNVIAAIYNLEMANCQPVYSACLSCGGAIDAP